METKTLRRAPRGHAPKAHPLDSIVGRRCTILLRNSAHISGLVAARANGHLRLTGCVVESREPDGSVATTEVPWVVVAESVVAFAHPAVDRVEREGAL